LTLQELRRRFDDSHTKTLELLLEKRSAASGPGDEIHPKAMRLARQDVLAFKAEQEVCISAAQSLIEALQEK
jgi:hypothetical protein